MDAYRLVAYYVPSHMTDLAVEMYIWEDTTHGSYYATCNLANMMGETTFPFDIAVQMHFCRLWRSPNGTPADSLASEVTNRDATAYYTPNTWGPWVAFDTPAVAGNGDYFGATFEYAWYDKMHSQWVTEHYDMQPAWSK